MILAFGVSGVCVVFRLSAVTTMMVLEGMAKTEVMMKMVAAVYWREHWFVSIIYEFRIM
jgi:hypothetical protein